MYSSTEVNIGFFGGPFMLADMSFIESLNVLLVEEIRALSRARAALSFADADVLNPGNKVVAKGVVDEAEARIAELRVRILKAYRPVVL